jgi:hypothetical protein
VVAVVGEGILRQGRGHGNIKMESRDPTVVVGYPRVNSFKVAVTFNERQGGMMGVK